MRVLIIEDEKFAAARLSDMITELEPSVVIEPPIESVRIAVQWFNSNPHPDLAFMDIQLADGISFEIFDKVVVDIPVIFTTAFNEYALRAFKVNSIDYLLKPIDKEELRLAIVKYKKSTQTTTPRLSVDPEAIKQVWNSIQNPYRSRFVVKMGEHIKTISVDDISCIYSNEKSTFIRTILGRDYALETSLDQLDYELNPMHFFRVSRKYIVSTQHIIDIIAYSGSRLKLNITGCFTDEILVSREKVTDFKKWLEG